MQMIVVNIVLMFTLICSMRFRVTSCYNIGNFSHNRAALVVHANMKHARHVFTSCVVIGIFGLQADSTNQNDQISML
jgi:hypothetical protein